MQNIDLTPLYRTLVGFDRMSSLIDQALRLDAAPSYPPFNLEQIGDDAFRIEIAVAGFSEPDLSIEQRGNQLTVAGKRGSGEDAPKRYLHRGIAERAFERRFQLADHVRVTNARLENGMLAIELIREIPEAAKPRKIAIGASKQAAAAIDAKSAPVAKSEEPANAA